MLTSIKKATLSSLFLATINIYAQDVKIATDNTGNFLIAPLYVAKGDICSDVKVMNTNEYSSILAKVTIREMVASHEVDLPILLSPGDVWIGRICQVKDRVILQSFDDSNHPSAIDTLRNGIDLYSHSSITSYRENDYNKGFVELNGKSYYLEEQQKNNLNFNKGYIEVYPIAQFDEGTKNKVQKRILANRWDRLIDNDVTNPKLRKSGVDNDSLSGLISFNTINQETASITMKAFENAHGGQIAGESINYSSDSNPDILLGKENKKQILKLLQNSILSFSFDDFGIDQYIHIAYPFSHKEKQSRKFKVVVRDLNENKYTMVFSPNFIMHDELACISVEELVNITNNKIKFEAGMIQITDIKNNDEVQLGKGEKASFLPTLSRITNKMGRKDIVVNSIYTPVK